MTADLDELQRVARFATELGGKLLVSTPVEQVLVKSDRDYVTDLDMKIQHEIRDYLERESLFAFFGEELDHDQRGELDQTEDWLWVLDPIDGTSNYIHGIPLCAVSLALLHRGKPVVGVIFAPFLGLEYYAVSGGGSYVNGTKISASTTNSLHRAIVSVGDYAVGVDAAEKNGHRLQITGRLAEKVERVRMFGSAALDLAWVAEGRTEACVILSNKPWDTAAGVLLAREAGALVVDAAGDDHTFQSSETIAVAPLLVDHLLPMLA